jgi:hypothetical protein
MPPPSGVVACAAIIAATGDDIVRALLDAHDVCDADTRSFDDVERHGDIQFGVVVEIKRIVRD